MRWIESAGVCQPMSTSLSPSGRHRRDVLAEMNRAISQAIGAPEDGIYRWQSLFVQTVQSLEQAPRAILFRSNESLASGTSTAFQRSLALSYINRCVAMMTPWLVGAGPAGRYPVSGAAYRCGRLQSSGTEVLLVTSESTRGDETLAGDGKAIEILLPPDRNPSNRLANDGIFSGANHPGSDRAWGADTNHFSRRCGNHRGQSRCNPRRPARPIRVAIRSESCFRSLALGARTSSLRVQNAWNEAVASGATAESIPVGFLTVAGQTLDDAERSYRAGEIDSTLHLSRRADAWSMRSSWQLSDALKNQSLAGSPAGARPMPISCPPIDGGQVEFAGRLADVDARCRLE